MARLELTPKAHDASPKPIQARLILNFAVLTSPVLSPLPGKMAIITLPKLPPADTVQDETQDQGDEDDGHS